jgi:hypothetical protein
MIPVAIVEVKSEPLYFSYSETVFVTSVFDYFFARIRVRSPAFPVPNFPFP